MDELSFEDLPLSFRLSQRSMLAAVGILLLSQTLRVQQWPIAARWWLAAVVSTIVCFALFISAYVVIRYPFISLVETSDEDIFAQTFTSKTLTRLTKATALTILGVILLSMALVLFTKGNLTVFYAISIIYVTVLFGFVCYVCFFYDAESHPTLATFIRSTLGVGIVLSPLFLPILAVGSYRCRLMLDAEIKRQQLEHVDAWQNEPDLFDRHLKSGTLKTD